MSAPRRPSGRTLVSVALVTGLVALGANTASYAAGGPSLLLGKVNKAGHTTTLVTSGKGPALALKSKPKDPSLSVTSKAQVKNLNASLLGGQAAGALSPVTTDFGQGQNNQPLPSSGVRKAALPAGDYSLNLDGYLAVTDTSQAANFECIALDQDLLTRVLASPSTTDFDGLYLLENQSESDVGTGNLTGEAFESAVIHVPKATTLYYGCFGINVTARLSPVFSLRGLNGTRSVTGPVQPIAARPNALARLGGAQH